MSSPDRRIRLGTELVGGRHPPQLPAIGKLAVQIGGFGPEDAVVIAKHATVPEAGKELAIPPTPHGEVGTEELMAITRSVPSQ